MSDASKMHDSKRDTDLDISRGRRQALKTSAALIASSLVTGLAQRAFAASPTRITAVSAPALAPAFGDDMNQLKLTAQDVQIVFVDLQPSLIASSQTVKPQALATAAGVLARVAHVLDLPMTFSLVPEHGGPGSLIPELAEYANEKNTFPRVVASPFMEPTIVSALASHSRKVLVVAGFSAEVAVLQSTLGAIGAGYMVQIPVDTMGSRSARTEDAVMRQMEKAGAIPTSVLSLSALLAPDFSQQPGSAVLSALAGLRAAN